MNVYWFDVDVAGPVTEDHAEVLGDVLTSRGGIDATVQAGEQGGVVMFSREADDAVQAFVSAIGDVEAAGLTVAGVTEDLVAADEIAARARTRLGEVDQLAAETARACALISAALTVRRGLRDCPGMTGP